MFVETEKIDSIILLLRDIYVLFINKSFKN